MSNHKTTTAIQQAKMVTVTQVVVGMIVTALTVRDNLNKTCL